MNAGAIVREYYSRIDGCDVDWVVTLFRDDAVYVRADAIYTGLPAIERFFRIERGIRGTHCVNALVADDTQDVVFAAGRFTGWGRASDARAIDYADMWAFDKAGLVIRRQTYLGTGSAYVHE